VSEREDGNGRHEIAFEAFGVRLAVGASPPELLDRVRPYLPPGWRACPASTVERRFALAIEETGTYAVTRDGKTLGGGRGIELELALELLDSQMRLYIGRKAPNSIFVHAGAVAHRGKAIVMPAKSFGGKTTLVAALVRAGATYYSDEFAVLDQEGLVHPYAKPLSIRGDGWMQTDHPVDSFGGVAGEDALPLGAIVVTTYRSGAEWRPRRLSAGGGAMALVANAVPAQERPEEVLRTIARAAEAAVVIESDRGEAEEVAPQLLAELDALAA
jgi:hypothetical protein